MIHVLNNLANDYDVIISVLENHLMATGDNALTIKVIGENSFTGVNKLRIKKRRK